ncbi:MAG: hypothetical protein A3C71_00445 [Candidatus Yanofskybacteria bacterium RIFCSPHIGHO2_02_FULL_43_15c]|uniref:Uncharacterized protein n=1 Tax=Candidatus Yanofskybacteria bacterium RIFCSPHIGHO2_02_FULL_43_15c TaxID=1802679 RepID=A0A1F8FIY4_9BACT|nr:MAG: hypothetical protein A3C71_00445 [Candidatus Yanofskybacteria bacterium RIFCSPHIGHO2_02_FULL_43_15c]
MQTKLDYKKQATKLRKRGWSYNEIRRKIPVAKSTLSLWLKYMELKPKYKKRLYTKMIVECLSKGASSQKERRDKKFWSELTGIPFQNFGKSFVKPVSSGYKKNNLYYGTMRIEVPKSVNIKHRIFGWVSGALKNIAPKVERPKPVNL